jgi:hypothetical protein
MDFPSMPQWHKELAILLRNPDKPTIEAGDGLEIDINGTVLQPVVVVIPPRPLADVKMLTHPRENTPNVFSWRGSFYGLVIGEHIFQFLESETNPGGTKMIQTEDITGVMQFLFAPWFPEWLGGINKVSLDRFNLLNGNLKERAERSG